MRQVVTALQEHIDGGALTLATCWKISRRDGDVLGFCDYSTDLTIDGVDYHAQSGVSASAVEDSSDFNVDNLSVEAVLDSEHISTQDLLAGRYDFAEVEVFMVNYTDPDVQKLRIRRGWLGEVRMGRHHFEAQMQGMMQKLSYVLGDVFSDSCRVAFGDARCGVDATTLAVTGIITEVSSRVLFTDVNRTESAGYFTHGQLTFSTGNSAGVAMEVKRFEEGKITLMLPLPAAVQVGDAYEMTPGCDRTFYTCRTRYGNAVNFRGEPHIPGTDKMLETSSTRS